MQKFSQEQLIEYLFGECSPIIKLAIETRMKEDAELEMEIKTLQRTIAQVKKLDLDSPRDIVIENILQYARNTEKKNPPSDSGNE